MRPVELGEVAIEALLVCDVVHSCAAYSARPRAVRRRGVRRFGRALRTLSSHCSGDALAVEHVAQAGGDRGVDALALEGLGRAAARSPATPPSARTAASTWPARHARAHQLAGAAVAAALGHRGGHQVARAGQPGEGLAAAAARAPPARAPPRRRGRRPRRRGWRRAAAAAAEASAAAFLAQAASSAPVTSSVVSTVRPPASSTSRSWRRRSALRVATHDRGARPRSPRARARDRRGWRRRGRARARRRRRVGRRAERRHEALRGHQHGAAVAHPRADLADRGGQAAAGHREHHEVDAGELDLAHGLGLDRVVERDAGQVVGVLAVVEQALGLRGRCGSRAAPRGRRARARWRSPVPIEPAPTTAAVRSGGRPPSHSHWSPTQGQMRSVTSPARNGDGFSTRG